MTIERIETSLSDTLNFRYVNDGREPKFHLDRKSGKAVELSMDEANELLEALAQILSILPEEAES